MDRTLESRFEERSIQVPSGVINLDGDLRIPENARGVVLFVQW
ncbi:hypothetical protein AB0758_44855 [Tolypothrix bouteillei VB521301_2]